MSVDSVASNVMTSLGNGSGIDITKLARDLATHMRPLRKKGLGAKTITKELNMKQAALKLNGKAFCVSKVQRLLKRQEPPSNDVSPS